MHTVITLKDHGIVSVILVTMETVYTAMVNQVSSYDFFSSNAVVVTI